MRIITCKRCLNDSTVKGITFNEDGICCYCLEYEKNESVLTNYHSLELLFKNRLNKNKQNYEYDCAVGFSGGKDSGYVLYKLVREYKLKVKAFTLDNGFLSEEARDNIDTIIKDLNVEHEYITASKDILFKTYRYTLKKYLSPCIACSFLGYIYMINYAARINARVAVHGRSFPQMFKSYQESSTDIFAKHIHAGLKKAKETNFKNLYLNMLDECKKYISEKTVDYIKENIIADSMKNGFREFVAYFLYHPYDKKEIIRYLKENTPWKYENETEHFDCEIHNAAVFLKNITARRAHIMPEVSVSVRNKTISKEDGLNILKDSLVKYPKDEIDLMFKRIKVNKTLTFFKAGIYGKRWW